MKYMRQNASGKHVKVKSMVMKHTMELIENDNEEKVKRLSDVRKTCVSETEEKS